MARASKSSVSSRQRLRSSARNTCWKRPHKGGARRSARAEASDFQGMLAFYSSRDGARGARLSQNFNFFEDARPGIDQIGMAQPIAPDYGQQFLFPPALDDWVSADHPVRFLREFVEQLDLPALHFAMPAGDEGRPPYAPGLLLKIWL